MSCQNLLSCGEATGYLPAFCPTIMKRSNHHVMLVGMFDLPTPPALVLSVYVHHCILLVGADYLEDSLGACCVWSPGSKYCNKRTRTEPLVVSVLVPLCEMPLILDNAYRNYIALHCTLSAPCRWVQLNQAYLLTLAGCLPT